MAINWTEKQDRVAGLLAKLDASKVEIQKAAEKVGVEYSAMNMRVSNFQSLAGNPGLQNASKQSQKVFGQLVRLTEDECRAELLKLMS
jgi:hypothetical protein